MKRLAYLLIILTFVSTLGLNAVQADNKTDIYQQIRDNIGLFGAIYREIYELQLRDQEEAISKEAGQL